MMGIREITIYENGVYRASAVELSDGTIETDGIIGYNNYANWYEFFAYNFDTLCELKEKGLTIIMK